MSNDVVNFSEAEKAFLNSGGQGSPYPDEKVELPVETPVETPEPEKPEQKAGETKPEDEPEKQEEGEDEEVEVADSTDPDGKPRRKMIAFGAYDKQRKVANNLKGEVAKLQQELAYLRGLSEGKIPAQISQPEAVQQTTPPDKAKDPEGYLKWLENAALKIHHTERQTQAQTEQQRHFQELNEAVIAHEQTFINGDEASGIKPHPDFVDAVNFLQAKQRRELQVAGYEPQEIQKILAARAQDVSIRALRAGDSPARRVYEIARENGYKRVQKPEPPKETEAEKIARQAKNQEKAGKSISELSGGEASKGLTAETLANMDPKEFLKKWNNGDAKALMGWVD